jgi:hypothetical protein
VLLADKKIWLAAAYRPSDRHGECGAEDRLDLIDASTVAAAVRTAA